jgi:glucokinase
LRRIDLVSIVPKPSPVSDLVADIGGTYTRFALAQAGVILPDSLARIRTSDFPTLAKAAQHYLAQRPQSVQGACFAVAGPVFEDEFQLTNSAWHDSVDHLRKELQLDRVQLINDFKAIALAIPLLPASQLLSIGAAEPAPAGLSRPARAVIGPGTGFGSALLLETDTGPIVIPGEGGHVALAADDAQEMALLDWLMQHGHVNECETFISGPGIELLHRALCDISSVLHGNPGTSEIVQRALEGDAQCRRTLLQFCAWLGSLARDYALQCGARGGVYIAGGVALHFAEFLQQSDFRIRFENSRKMQHYLRTVPTYLITAENPGLIGAAWQSNQQEPET